MIARADILADLDRVEAERELRMSVVPTAAEASHATLQDVHDTFGKRLGAEYDLAAIDAVLAAAAAERLDGDPLWLLLISGSGAAKTESVQPLAGAGALVTSTITSEGAGTADSSLRPYAHDRTAASSAVRRRAERWMWR